MAMQRWLGWRGVAMVLGLFALSRCGWWLAGVRFDASPLDWYWQIVDLDLLRHRFAESLWYLHAQPPAFSGLIGAAAAVGDPALVLRWCFAGFGALLTVALADGLHRLGWSTPWAVVAAVTLANGLPWVVTEHWLFYDFPCAVLLGVAGWALLRLDDCRRIAIPVFALASTGLALLRSLFHPVWLVVALVLLIWATPRSLRRRAMLASMMGLILVGLVIVKNGVLFGVWGSSSWLGMSLAKMTTARLQPAERAALVRDGSLSPFARVRPFSPVESYEQAAGTRWEDGSIPVLSRRTRSGGAPNYNHAAYLDIARECRMDAMTVIRRRPDVYAVAVAGSVATFVQSPLRYPAFEGALDRVRGAWWLYERTVGLPPLTVVLLLVASVVAAMAVRAGDRGLAAAAAWFLLNLLWVAGVASCLEIGENNRFQALVSPMMWVVILESGRWALSRRRRPGPDPTR